MARPAALDRGKEFIAGVAQHLPDDLRAGLERFLGSPDASNFLREVGTGVLRQDEFSRQMDGLSTQKQALDTWRQQLEDWKVRAEAELAPLAPGDKEPPPSRTASGDVISRQDAEALLTTELGRREVYFAQFVGDATRLQFEHYRRFGEPLDINAILAHPKLAELRLEGAYKDLFKDKLAAAEAADQAKKEAELEAKIRAKVVAELGQAPGAAAPPYPVGDSPLDHLGAEVPPWDPAAVTAAYNTLVSGKTA